MRDRGWERGIKITVSEGKIDGARQKVGEWKYKKQREENVR